MAGRKKSTKKTPKVPYKHKPKELTLHEWQIALRKQFVEKNAFSVQKTGAAPVWTDYLVQNPRNSSAYTVALRSLDIGINYCNCGDFRTNSLGTCKHIEAVAQYVKKKRGLKRHLKVPYEAPNSSIFLRYGIERHVCLRVGTEATTGFKRAVHKYFEEDQVFKEIEWKRFPFILKKLKKLAPDLDLKPDAMKFILEKRADAERTEVIKPLKRRWRSYFDSLLKIRPYPYQAQGVWYAVETGRSLIADEMGLGKTIQAIAAAAVFHAEFNVKKTLIICPTSLKYQWKAEIEKFSYLRAQIIEGSPGVRRRAYRESDAFFLIISHHLVYYDIDHLTDFEPDLIILDEAQRIKNWSTKISRNIKRLQSQYAIVLTGTPLENKIEELYSILQFVNPHVLPPVFEFLYNHRILDESGKVIGYKDMHAIKAQLAPVMIRRRKAEVLSELPERSDQNILLPVTEEQLVLHEEFQNGVSRLVHKWRRFGFLSEKDRLRLMILLGQMRMVADSTYLIDQQDRHDTKIRVIRDLIEEILQEGNNKVVIFSEWLKMHSLIIQQLEEMDLDYVFLNGSVASKKRGEIVHRFQDDASCRVFLSSDAGGTGLNLQAANYVINVDLPWNPAKLEQRIARVHRIGQNRHVTAINLISLQTIEHKMLGLLDFKSSAAAGILDHGEDIVFLEDKKLDQIINEVETLVEDVKDDAAESHAVQTEITFQQTEEVSNNVPDSKIKRKRKPEDSIEQRLLDEVVEESSSPAQQEKDYDADELIATGAQFFKGLLNTLKDKQQTEKLVSKLVKKEGDKTYLQIPVESEKVVKDVLGMLSNLFRQE